MTRDRLGWPVIDRALVKEYARWYALNRARVEALRKAMKASR